ncbi:MAG: hypothetical protein VZS44_12390 [Bacilli bacterium]|nr:hypothetical protein [Bacilli bacterium]
MTKDEKIKVAIIMIIVCIIYFFICKYEIKKDEKDIAYCLNQGYSYDSCTDFLR